MHIPFGWLESMVSLHCSHSIFQVIYPKLAVIFEISPAAVLPKTV